MNAKEQFMGTDWCLCPGKQELVIALGDQQSRGSTLMKQPDQKVF